MSFPLDKPLYRYAVSTGKPVYRTMPKRNNGYGSKHSERLIIHLHKIEAKLRREIAEEQIVHWSKAQIEARYG